MTTAVTSCLQIELWDISNNKLEVYCMFMHCQNSQQNAKGNATMHSFGDAGNPSQLGTTANARGAELQ